MTNTETAGIKNYRALATRDRVSAGDVLEACYAAVDNGVEDDITKHGRAVGRVMAALLALPFDGIAEEVVSIVEADRAGLL